MFGGVVGNMRAVDVLHHKVGELFLGSAAVEESRNVGVMQPRQNLPFAPEAAQNEISIEARTYYLYGHIRLVLFVGARGQVDGTHAAPSDFADHVVCADS